MSFQKKMDRLRNEELSIEVFENPGKEFRGAPFWAWNTKLEEEELLRQIEQFKRMGFGGFHIHPRTGLETEYLSDEYMAIVKACILKAEKEDMLAWLYDEDRWPSGAAGGLVTKEREHRICHLLLTRVPYGLGSTSVAKTAGAKGSRTENGELLACYEIEPDKDGSLKNYYRVSPDKEDIGASCFKLYAYVETGGESPWFNNQTYVNTLDKRSVSRFIEITYERYKEVLSEHFGNVIPAIFTDEPQFSSKQALNFAHEEKDITIPWTNDFIETYQEAYGTLNEQLLDHIPQLLWELPAGRISCHRYCYHDHIAKRFVTAFVDQCGDWCREHGLLLTGHMMEEPTLEGQTKALGDAMRSYPSFGLPGIDILSDHREFTTAKQAQSATRQHDYPGVISELYGVTNWDFDFRKQKLQGDWQAALGVTHRVPHLSWVSMKGEAKRDYPATFNYQVPWCDEYPYLEDHYARIAAIMTRGKAECRIGVIHPIESYWLHWGPKDSTHEIRRQMESDFHDLCNWLLRSHLDFDYICESTLPIQTKIEDVNGDGFTVGEMDYRIIILPKLKTIRATTLERLERFQEVGGRILFLGEPPSYVDAHGSEKAIELWRKSIRLPFEQYAILQSLEEVRLLDIRNHQGERVNHLLHQIRREEGKFWVFIAHADPMIEEDYPLGDNISILFKGFWKVVLYDTIAGVIREIPWKVEGERTVIDYKMYEHDSLLLLLEPQASPGEYIDEKANVNGKDLQIARIDKPVRITLHEPNVMVLDMAEYALDDGEWQKREEVLRLDNLLREQIGWQGRDGHIPQPYIDKDYSTPHRLHLRFTFFSNLVIPESYLATEFVKEAVITLNGVQAGKAVGWYVDKCFRKIKLPVIVKGANSLDITIPYGPKTDVEAVYLLGEFGVQVKGDICTLEEAIKELAFGDITSQGLPFYGGNISYHFEAESRGGLLEIEVSNYRGHLLRVLVDGEDVGVIALSPYRMRVANLDDGVHQVELVYYGCRINTFGQLHKLNRENYRWWPDSWRTDGVNWSYEYKFWEQGVLTSPNLKTTRCI